MPSGEMLLCDAWQPAVMAVNAQGKPCKYPVPNEGYRAGGYRADPGGNRNR